MFVFEVETTTTCLTASAADDEGIFWDCAGCSPSQSIIAGRQAGGSTREDDATWAGKGERARRRRAFVFRFLRTRVASTGERERERRKCFGCHGVPTHHFAHHGQHILCPARAVRGTTCSATRKAAQRQVRDAGLGGRMGLYKGTSKKRPPNSNSQMILSSRRKDAFFIMFSLLPSRLPHRIHPVLFNIWLSFGT